MKDPRPIPHRTSEEDPLAISTAPGSESALTARSRKPLGGRPVLFAAMLLVATLGVLVLLVVGPTAPLPVALVAAAGLVALVALAWVVAGPRL